MLSKSKHIQALVSFFHFYVNVGQTEKKFGEVITPLSLVKEMLSKVPEEVWKNPNLRWLDPCAGCGMFPFVIVQKLMIGLEEFEPNEHRRYKHIMENMLFVCEIQSKNTELFKHCFDPENEYNLNVFTGSFVDVEFDDQMKLWSVDKFDVIVANPPYQKNTAHKGLGNSLWDQFVMKSFGILTEGGFLVNVHPAGWRNISGYFKEIGCLLKSKQMLYLSIHGAKDGKKTFGATTRYDWYCLRNLPNNGLLTQIRCQDGTLEKANLASLEFIPNAMLTLVRSFFANDGEERVDILYTGYYHPNKSHMAKEKTKEHIYPCIQNINTKGECGKIYYSSINNVSKNLFGTPKVIFNSYGINTYVDINGEYGMCQHCAAVKDEPENLHMIAKALQNPQFKEIMKASYVGGIRDTPINKEVLARFRKDFWKQFV